MMNRLKTSLNLLFVVLLSAASWHFVTQTTPTPPLDKIALSKTPDIIIEHVKVRQFDTHGLLVNQLETPYIEHIPFLDEHYITAPHILIAQDNKTPWEIQAKHAVTVDKNKAIKFYEDVTIKKLESDTNAASTLYTSEILYYPKEKLALTDKKVLFSQPQTVVEATGMRAYLEENRIQLLEKARGRHEPAKG